jgi:hypothetical protein
MRPRRFRIPFPTFVLVGHAFQRVARAPRKPRHRALRVVLGVLGLGVLALMIAFGLFLGLAMLAIGAVLRLWALRRAAPGRATPRDAFDGTAPGRRALDGNFRVVRKPALPAR